VKTAALCVLVSLAAGISAAGEDAVTVEDYSKLPANTWVLIHSEDNSGGKAFARLVLADNVNRLYLWGTGGKKPARNVFLRYELESLDPKAPQWLLAFPESMRGKWTAERFPPFRIYGQTGLDGLKYDEGPHASRQILISKFEILNKFKLLKFKCSKLFWLFVNLNFENCLVFRF